MRDGDLWLLSLNLATACNKVCLRAIYTDDLSSALSHCGTISNVQGTRVIIHCVANSEIEKKSHRIAKFHVKLSELWFLNHIAMRCDFIETARVNSPLPHHNHPPEWINLSTAMFNN